MNPNHSPEHHNQPINPEGQEKLERLAQEHQDSLRERLEQQPETANKDLEELRQRAAEQAHESEPVGSGAEQILSPAEKRSHGQITKVEREQSFNHTMRLVQNQMSTPERAFSRVIHKKGVERGSEIVAATVARPNALLAGAVTAFVITLAVYLIAKNYGYPLSGSESIMAFIAGWLLGILFDFLRTMVTGRKE